jgi:ABC-type transport system substrate-binding protein
MRRTSLLPLAAVSLVLGAALWPLEPEAASLRPAYGGVLRMMTAARVVSLDPSVWPAPAGDPRAATANRLAELALETLVRVDGEGRPAPLLATTWQHDRDRRSWQFRLRRDVHFHDGSPMTPSMVAAALNSIPGRGWRAGVFGETLVIESAEAVPDLLAQLALPRHGIAARARDGSLVATGPFRIAEWVPEQRARFVAFDEHWAGRPFLDAVEVTMGVPLRQQATEFELGRADLVELAPAEARRAAEAGTRVWQSAPAELFALVAGERGPAADLRLREAVARAVDRAALHEVLLGGTGATSGAVLPQWLSGYAFLLPPAPRDTERARALAAELRPARPSRPARGAATPPVALVYDAADPLAQALAERIVVDARAAGLTLEPVGRDLAAADADFRLLRWWLTAADPVRALADFAAALGEPLSLAEVAGPESLYAVERALLDSFRVVPLAHLPEAYALNERVKNWQPASHGRSLGLAELWLVEAPRAARVPQ